MIAIIAILASMLLPALGKAKEKGVQSTCMANIKQLCVGFMQYADDYDEYIPPYVSDPQYNLSWVNTTLSYCGGARASYACPAQKVLANPKIDYGVIYPRVSGVATTKKLGQIVNHCAVAMLTETEAQSAAGRTGPLYLAYSPFTYAVGSISWAMYNGLAIPGRHMGGNNSGFVDGHGEWQRRERTMANRAYWNQ